MARGLTIGQQRALQVSGRSLARTVTPDSVVSQYDAQALSLSDGDTVSTWTDEQNTYDLSATGDPIYRASGINGYASVELDGANDLFDNSNPTILQPYTVIYVGKITGSTGNDHTVFDSDSSNFSLSRLDNGKGNRAWNAGSDITGNSPDTNPHIVTNIGDGTSGLLRVDGTDEASGDAGTNDITGFQLGASYDDSRYLAGYIGEVLVYDNRLSSSEISDEEQRLSDKWGITI